MDEAFVLQGPVSVSEWFSRKLRKHIYVFSDIHNRTNPCEEKDGKSIDVSEFLKMTLRDNGDKLLDFYLEIPLGYQYDQDAYEYDNGYLTDTGSQFKQCLGRDATGCEYQNVRIHSIDIRECVPLLFNLGNLNDYLEPNSRKEWVGCKFLAKYILNELTSLEHVFIIAKVKKTPPLHQRS